MLASCDLLQRSRLHRRLVGLRRTVDQRRLRQELKGAPFRKGQRDVDGLWFQTLPRGTDPANGWAHEVQPPVVSWIRRVGLQNRRHDARPGVIDHIDDFYRLNWNSIATALWIELENQRRGHSETPNRTAP